MSMAPVDFKEHNDTERKEAIERYYLRPNVCLHCGKVIPVGPKQRVHEVRAKKFCNSSCFGYYTNKAVVRKHKSRKKIRHCRACSAEITRGKGKGHYCQECLAIIKRKNRPPIEDRTKGELFSSRKNWQSARGAIVKHANMVYERSNRPQCCCICGYEKHFQVAHRKAVSDFPNEATIGEINDIDNLGPLCPNHHWEQENGFIELPESI
jgi:hypothetical protein